LQIKDRKLQEEVLEKEVLSLIVEFLVPARGFREVMETLKDVSKKNGFLALRNKPPGRDGKQSKPGSLKARYSAYPEQK
jgi:hypothetical protein